MDLKIKTNEGQVILIEIKPDKQTKPPSKPDKSRRYISESLTYVKNQNKWIAAKKFALDRGWDFQIWTEHTLKALGIMKELKTLKPIKPLRKTVKKKR
jgi:hypothetical protein